MTMLSGMPESVLSAFCLWSILLLCLSFAAIVLSIAIRRYRYTAYSAAAFVLSFLLFEVLCDLTGSGGSGQASSFAAEPGRLPWGVWAAGMTALTALTGLMLLSAARYSRIFITPLTIKYCGDRMGCGILYYRENGRVIFSNRCMNEIAAGLTGNPIRSGAAFESQLTEEAMTVGDRVWRFSLRDLTFGGEPLREIVAVDVTKVYEQAEILRKDNETLSRLNDELKAYSLRIDDTVRREEILQAKVNIHDEMNRLMMTTAAADGGDREKLAEIFTLWQRDAVLLCMEAEERKDTDAVLRLQDLAEALNIRLLWDGGLPVELTQQQREVFSAAAREAVTNAGKHADAETLEISFEETAAYISCRFSNDGRLPGSPVRFSGGLQNLALLAEDQHGFIRTETAENRFVLSLTFWKNF